MTRKLIALSALCLALCGGASARAGLIVGQSLNGNLAVALPATAQVFDNSTAILSDSAVEFSGADPNQPGGELTDSADLTASTLTISFAVHDTNLIGLGFSKDNWLFTFTSLPVESGTAIIGLSQQPGGLGRIDVSSTAWTSDSITIGVKEFLVDRAVSTASVTFDILFSAAPAVPEPSSLALGGTAVLAGLGLACRRRRP